MTEEEIQQELAKARETMKILTEYEKMRVIVMKEVEE